VSEAVDPACESTHHGVAGPHQVARHPLGHSLAISGAIPRADHGDRPAVAFLQSATNVKQGRRAVKRRQRGRILRGAARKYVGMVAFHLGEFGVHVDAVQGLRDLWREFFPDVGDSP
jgi:hypothetical protein